jgi:CheY-like chemotaxis protein
MPLRVLYVDDDADTRESLAVLLRLKGFEADVAAGRDEALAAARAHPPDVILMDLGLPGCDGYQVAKELLGLCPGKPLLLALTGHAEEEYRRRSEQEGFALYLLKPVDAEVLLRFLRAYEAARNGGVR